MMKTLIALVMVAAAGSPAFAATLTNADDTTHTIIVSEGGSQTEMSIGPGETVEICPSGCFVTMPNGDRQALTGSETLQIEQSRGKIF